MKTKKSIISFMIVLVFTAFVVNVFGQNNKYPFQVQKSGRGNESIIFIPGFACSGSVWDDTKAQYESRFTCYTLTMAGFAGEPAMAKPTYKGWEQGIAAYIKDQKIDKPIIIGHSMGGGLALALAADYPDLISKIVVVDALPCLNALMNPTFKSVENNDCSAMVSQFSGLSNEAFYQMQKKSIPSLMTDTTKQELVVSWSVKSDRATFAAMYCDFSNTDLREKIANIKCPALILLESYFANMKPAINDQYKNMKKADLQYATKGLHFIMFDDKKWYDQQLRTFLK